MGGRTVIFLPCLKIKHCKVAICWKDVFIEPKFPSMSDEIRTVFFARILTWRKIVKKRLFIVAAFFLISMSAFSISLTLKAGGNFGMSHLMTDSFFWNDDALKSGGNGFGFYAGIDFMFTKKIGLYLDVPLTFGKEFRYDGYLMDGDASYFDGGVLFGLVFAPINTGHFEFYLGFGLGVLFQNLEQKENSEFEATKSLYEAMGLNLKMGVAFYPIKWFGIDLSVSDSVGFATKTRLVRIGYAESDDLSDDFSISNFFNVNLAFALKFGT